MCTLYTCDSFPVSSEGVHFIVKVAVPYLPVGALIRLHYTHV